MRNMLKYIQTGTASDIATEFLDKEVKEARLKEEWRAEYMLTLVHDIDMRREGYESRQEEVDVLNATIVDKDATIAEKDATIASLQEQLDALLKSKNNSLF